MSNSAYNKITEYDQAAPVDEASEELLEWVLQDLREDLSYEVNRIRKTGASSLIQWAYVATVGTGKTYALVRAACEAADKGWRVAIRTSTTANAWEIQREISNIAPGISKVWLGREQRNPAKPHEKMCPRSLEVTTAQAVGGDPNDVCGSKKRGYCKYHPSSQAHTCGYKEQDLSNSSVVIFAGDGMLELVPREPMRQASRKNQMEFDLVILDEFDPQGLIHRGTEEVDVDCNSAIEMKLSKDPCAQEILNSFLRVIKHQVLEGRRYLKPWVYDCSCNLMTSEEWLELTEPSSKKSKQNPDENVEFCAEKQQPLIDEAMTFETLETVREVALESIPKTIGKDKFQELPAEQIYLLNKDNVKTRKVLLAIAKVCELMIQGIAREIHELKHLEVLPDRAAISVNYLKKINLHYFFPPVLVFDATLQYDLAKYILPNLKIRFQRKVSDGPCVKRYQLYDTSLSYSTIKSSKTWPVRLKLWANICSRIYGKTGFLVPKFVREQVDDMSDDILTLGHFGDLKGTNRFSDVNALIVASRPAVKPKIAERAAAIISWKNIEELDPKYEWYPREDCLLRYRHNADYAWIVRQDKHPDPLAEAMRRSVTEDSVEQAAGRGRNVRRSAGAPLTEYLLTNVPTERPLDGVFTLAQFKAVTSWVGVFLQKGLWVSLGSKGSGAILHKFACALRLQRPECLYITLIGGSAFDDAAGAASWRKKQLQDNFEISQLADLVDEALREQHTSVPLLMSDYPLGAFQLVQAKVQGSRYFAQVCVRVEGHETPVMALRRILGDELGEIEVK